jgi:hypothetical protein
MKAVQALQDNDGCWYLVSNDQAPLFRELVQKIEADGEDYYTALEQFKQAFGEYSIGGLNSIQLYIE